MFMARAENVVDITLIPAIPGTITLRSCWLPLKIAPKKAEEQQRQQEVEEGGARVAPEHPALEAVLAPEEAASGRDGGVLGIGGQLEVDVLEAGPA